MPQQKRHSLLFTSRKLRYEGYPRSIHSVIEPKRHQSKQLIYNARIINSLSPSRAFTVGNDDKLDLYATSKNDEIAPLNQIVNLGLSLISLTKNSIHLFKLSKITLIFIIGVFLKISPSQVLLPLVLTNTL